MIVRNCQQVPLDRPALLVRLVRLVLRVLLEPPKLLARRVQLDFQWLLPAAIKSL